MSGKPPLTSYLATPAYLLARGLTAAVENRGDRTILRAYLTTVMTSGIAFAALLVVMFRLLRRRLSASDAAMVTLGFGLGSPIWPNATMLSQHIFVCLVVLGSYALLERSRVSRNRSSFKRLMGAGVLAGLAASFEYWTPVVLLPLGIYVLFQTRDAVRLLGFGLGVGIALLIPASHNFIVFGHPLSVGYSHLALSSFAEVHQAGFFGFDGFRWSRLYELTFGGIRGAFVLSPFLVASIAGWTVLIRNRLTRPEGLATAGVGVGVLLLFSSYVYWHAGSSLGSRYVQLFVVFAAVPTAAVFPGNRRWIIPLMLLGLAFMTMGTAVCAIPPAPGPRPYEPVLVWLWRFFSEGRLAHWQQAVLLEKHIGDGSPDLPFAFNLGQLAGLEGVFSLIPFLLGLSVLLFWLRRETTRPILDPGPG